MVLTWTTFFWEQGAKCRFLITQGHVHKWQRAVVMAGHFSGWNVPPNSDTHPSLRWHKQSKVVVGVCSCGVDRCSQTKGPAKQRPPAVSSPPPCPLPCLPFQHHSRHHHRHVVSTASTPVSYVKALLKPEKPAKSVINGHLCF